MVGPCGFEPQTSCVSSRRSNQLSYGPGVAGPILARLDRDDEASAAKLVMQCAAVRRWGSSSWRYVLPYREKTQSDEHLKDCVQMCKDYGMANDCHGEGDPCGKEWREWRWRLC